MISYAEALDKILSEVRIYPIELVSLNQSLGRVLSADVTADRDYPPFHRSAMDGFAIHSHGYAQNQIYPYHRELPAGMSMDLEPNELAIRIMTGAPVPDGLDVVIKIEDATLSGSNGENKFRFP